MERVQDAEQTVEVFENEIQMYLSMFCESNAIEVSMIYCRANGTQR